MRVDQIKDNLVLTNPDIVRTMTHADCVNYAYHYLCRRCNVCLPEFYSWNEELADVIGFDSRHSTLIECKVSRSDFLNDKKKNFRVKPEKGMGDHRYYCCPKDLIKKEEVPTGWGLLYVFPSGLVRRIKESYFDDSREHDLSDYKDFYSRGCHPKNKDAEYHVLYYYARRANYAGVHKTILKYRGFDK
jgi:hypothetical protein